jgi:hypothetical protein
MVFRKIMVRSIGIGRKIEKRINTEPGRPKRRSDIVVIVVMPNRWASIPSRPSRSTHDTAIIYGGMRSGIIKRRVKNLRSGKSVFSKMMPSGTPIITVKIVTSPGINMLCHIRVH